MNFFSKTLYFLSAILLFFTLKGYSQQKQSYKISLIGFYNLENFYDTINEPGVNDEDFTPDGNNKYTPKVYLDKVSKLTEVLSQIGTDLTPDGLSVFGCAEVENESVLKDLVSQKPFQSRNYKIIEYPSPDERGIDVALIYNPKYFTPKFSEPLKVLLLNSDSTEHPTRDVLYVYGQYQGEPLHVLVNHWPSRRGGEEASAPLRAIAAGVCKHKIDSITSIDPNAKILVMGDLNDDPVSPSVAVILKSKGNKNDVLPGGLYNPWVDYYTKGIGTLAYNDAWNLFDQIMLSSGFLNRNQEGVFFKEALIFSKPFMVQKTGRYKGYPLRTYDFNIYQGGYSDHFPTYIVLLKKTQATKSDK